MFNDFYVSSAVFYYIINTMVRMQLNSHTFSNHIKIYTKCIRDSGLNVIPLYTRVNQYYYSTIVFESTLFDHAFTIIVA